MAEIDPGYAQQISIHAPRVGSDVEQFGGDVGAF